MKARGPTKPAAMIPGVVLAAWLGSLGVFCESLVALLKEKAWGAPVVTVNLSSLGDSFGDFGLSV